MEIKKWMETEHNFLAANWGKLSPAEIAAHLGRTKNSVQGHAQLNGIRSFTARDWTKEEIEQLQDLWGPKTIPQIAKIMGRTNNAIKVKSSRLGLGAYKDSSEYLSAQQVSSLLGVDSHTVTNYWIPKCGLKCRKIALLGKKKFKYIRMDNLLRWLEHNQDKWDSRRVELYALGVEPEWLKAKRKADMKLPARKAQKWTREEDKRLIFLFKTGNYTIAQIAEQMGRTLPGIEHRLSRLDVWGTGGYIGDKQRPLAAENQQYIQEALS
jgi:hypothetical protein